MFEVCEVAWGTRVRQVDFTLRAGEIMALVGPNGAGKSSLLALMSAQHRPDKGVIRLNGHLLAQLPPAAQAQQRAAAEQAGAH